MSAPRAVVTGASGFVGIPVVDELLRHGARVRCLVRRTSSRRWLDGKPVELFEAMVRIPGTVRGDHVRVLQKEKEERRES